MFYIQNDIVIDMADFFPLNKHSIDDKFQRLQQRIESVKNFKAKYNEVKQNNRQKSSDWRWQVVY